MSKPPAFQFYPKDWLSDLAVRSMTAEQRGYYIDLLATAWLEDGIPADEDQLRRIMGLTKRRFDAVWSELRSKWVSDGNGKLVNPRQERYRDEMRGLVERRREAGKRGAEARWNSEGPPF